MYRMITSKRIKDRENNIDRQTIKACWKWNDNSCTCKLPTMHYRHIRGDMIEMYKILSGKYDIAVTPRVNRDYNSITRGNDLRLQKTRVIYDLHKYYFTNRVLNIWNSLPKYVVLSDTVNTFKSRLEKFRQHQDVIYDFKAEIRGTRSRSCY